MCGVFGIVSHESVNQLLYDGLQMLQHRGQDAAGIVTTQGNRFHMHKGKGMVREVFRTRNMRDLHGNAGIAHVRYPTAGNAGSSAEAQPFYVSSPFGIVLAHNGNLTNTAELYQEVYAQYLRHVNTQSDSEILLNVFAHELRIAVSGSPNPLNFFCAASIGNQFFTRGHINAIHIGETYFWCSRCKKDFFRTRCAHHVHNLAAGGATHNGIIHQ